MLYQISHGAVRFAADTILEDINFEIRNTEKIAVVGRNGCGKTTLLKLIAGEVDLSKRDSDEHIFIAKAGNPVIGYLKQMPFEDDQITLDEEIRKTFIPILMLQEEMDSLLMQLETTPTDELVRKFTHAQERFQWLGGYEYQRECEIILKQFGFLPPDFTKKLCEFSGGQQTKISFARLLLSKPDILLLDEPTNHLDISTVEWLEGYLKTYNRAVVIVSHDRMFLDKVADVVYEIEYRTATRYPGNYSAFVARKRDNWEKQMKDHTLQQNEIQRLNQLIEKFKHHPTKVSMARSKQKQIEHMIKVEAPDRYDLRSFHANFTPLRQTGKEVLTVNHLAIGYDHVLSELSFAMTRGQKLAVIGANGIGKSTLLKTLTQAVPSLGGTFQYGFQVDIGYFDQQIAQFSSDKTVLDEFWEEFPDLTQTEVRTLLGSFLFTQDEVFKQVSMLSGGERARLALAKILKRRPNFLLLDEPTNHMDIIGKETLENMLSAYTGTLLFVSHDRYFVRQVADSLLIFQPEQVTYYPYGYAQYLAEQVPQEDAKTVPSSADDKQGKGAHPLPEQLPAINKRPNTHNPGKELARAERKLKRLEEQIEQLENKLRDQKDELLNPEHAANYEKLTEIQDSIKSMDDELMNLIYEWEEVSALLSH